MRNIAVMKVIVLTTFLAILPACGPTDDSNTDNSSHTDDTGSRDRDDSSGLRDRSNKKPIAVISPGAEQFIIVGGAIEFNGDSSFDTDRNTPLSYDWTFSGAGSSLEKSTDANPGLITFTETGVVTVSLVVTDSLGMDSITASIKVNIDTAGTNRAPNGAINYKIGNGALSSGDFTVSTGTNVEFSATASDADNDPVTTFDWVFPTGISVPANTGKDPFSVNFQSAGTYLITLSVSDDTGNTDPTPAKVNVTVTAPPVNLPPDGSISHDNGNGTTGGSGDIRVITGASIVFSGSAIDPESDPMTYAWNFPANVTLPQTPGSTPFTATFPVAGTYVITLTVSDDAGNTDPTPAQVAVTVADTPANQPPDGSISHDNGNGTTGSSGDLSIVTGSSIVFSGSAIDPEGDPVTYAWNVPANVTLPQAPDATPFTATFPVAGTYVITLTVSDDVGNTDPTPALVAITVTDAPVNLPPEGAISHDNGDGTTGSTGDINIAPGTSVVFSSSVVDPEGDPISYAWVFEGATPSTSTSSGPTMVTYDTSGSFSVRLTVSDNNGNSDLTPAELTVNVALPKFKHLPVLSDEDGNPNDDKATYNLNVNGNVNVNVVTPTGSWTTPMMRYNGLQLPPVIVAKRGTQMTFNVQNNLTEDTTIHWHGFKIPADQDGGPDMPIAAGASRTYSFTLVQPAGPLWFHPHAHGTTATQVYNGLAGGFVITDDISANLENTKQIPDGEQDIPLLIQDRLFAADDGTGVRTLIYQPGGMMNMAGMLGNRILVNGVELPGLEVETRQYRFRLYNGSNARTYDIALADNSTFKVVGTDGGLLNSPVDTDHITLGAGERAEIVVNFGTYAVGDNVMLVSRSFNTGGVAGGGTLPNGAAFDIMRFDVSKQETDDVVLYTTLPATADINTRLTATDATATRDFVMSMNMVMGVGMQFLINGRTFDMNRIDEVVASGATEIWNISNTSGMAHPFHAHAIQWQILDRNGVPATGVDLGWKDTVLVQPDENVRFIGRFDPVINKGNYMYHCHILEHEEAGMMGTFQVQ